MPDGLAAFLIKVHAVPWRRPTASRSILTLCAPRSGLLQQLAVAGYGVPE
jgi:hypothetical protein